MCKIAQVVRVSRAVPVLCLSRSGFLAVVLLESIVVLVVVETTNAISRNTAARSRRSRKGSRT